MHSINKYSQYIFDCDGVILDSNQLKIEAMALTLNEIGIEENIVKECINYFSNNFGKSRFHHVDVFIRDFFQIEMDQRATYRTQILELFSKRCKALYMQAHLTPGFIDFISSLEGSKFVASGSEQKELREVFKARGLDIYFNGIYGSPAQKSDLVAQILKQIDKPNAIMFGDAISDMEAAKNNKIDFVGYIPFSNVKEKLTILIKNNDYTLVGHWKELS